jgi:hypothetical protein
MNAGGVVAFDAFLLTGGEGIFTSTGTGTPATIADTLITRMKASS